MVKQNKNYSVLHTDINIKVCFERSAKSHTCKNKQTWKKKASKKIINAGILKGLVHACLGFTHFFLKVVIKFYKRAFKLLCRITTMIDMNIWRMKKQKKKERNWNSYLHSSCLLIKHIGEKNIKGVFVSLNFYILSLINLP